MNGGAVRCGIQHVADQLDLVLISGSRHAGASSIVQVVDV
jgi:hypothetical protein